LTEGGAVACKHKVDRGTETCKHDVDRGAEAWKHKVDRGAANIKLIWGLRSANRKVTGVCCLQTKLTVGLSLTNMKLAGG